MRRLILIAGVALACGAALAQAGPGPGRIDDPPVLLPGASDPLWQDVQIPLLPAGASLSALWAGSPNELYVWAIEGQISPGLQSAILPHSMLLHWSGQTWLSVIDVRGETGASIYGTGTNDVFAATSARNGAAKMYHINGLGWTEQVLPTGTRAPAGAIVGAPNDIYFRSNFDVVRYDGRAWQHVFTTDEEFVGGLTYIGPNEVYANCCTGHCIWNGAGWCHHDCGQFQDVGSSWGMRGSHGSASTGPSLSPAPLTMFAAGQSSATNGFSVWQFVEDSPGALHGEWVTVPLNTRKSQAQTASGLPSLVPDPPELPPSSGPEHAPGDGVAVWGASSADVYAAGVESKTGLLYHFDGVAWNKLSPLATMTPIADVSGSGPGDVWVSFTNGRLLHYTGGVSHPNPETAGLAVLRALPDASSAAAAMSGSLGALATRVVGTGSGVVTLEYSVPWPCDVSISAFDVAGRRTAALENAWRGAGTYQVSWNTSGLARGVYFYHVRAGGSAVSRRVVVLD